MFVFPLNDAIVPDHWKMDGSEYYKVRDLIISRYPGTNVPPSFYSKHLYAYYLICNMLNGVEIPIDMPMTWIDNDDVKAYWGDD